MSSAGPARPRPPPHWLVVGISGVTCGGKTSLANQLKNAIAPVYVFHQDKYFYPDDSPLHTKCSGLDHNNYDIMSALDMRLMYDDIVATMRGDNRAHHTRAARSDTLADRSDTLADRSDTLADRSDTLAIRDTSFLLVEGFTVLNYKPIMELCDLRYYIVLEYGECAARRSLRLYSPPDVAGYFDMCVWPEHCRYRAEIEKDSRVKFIDGTRADAFDIVMNDLRALDT